MKKKYILIAAVVAVVALIAAAGLWIYSRLHASLYMGADGTSVSIIGGADGPTSIFLAGKLGGTGETEKMEENTYTSISMEEAKASFSKKGDYIIVDVRRPDEYAGGHIPGAINIVNEEIAGEPEELPDKTQLIYVYCRSGRRSKEAAGKLAALGYQNIVECGGIQDWTGDIE